MALDFSIIHLAGRTLQARVNRPLIMGILNVTPDSFSDGGYDADAEASAQRGSAMIQAGADIIDVGPESSRPGSQPVDADEQIRRAIPVIQRLRGAHPKVCISVDTRLASVAEAALNGGADLINDISAGRDDTGMFALVARRGAGIVLMHMQNTPATMQKSPTYTDVVTEIATFLKDRTGIAVRAGIDREQIVIDPGIGFGKTTAHNLELLANLEAFTATQQPVLLGCSRKRFLAELGGSSEAKDRLAGSLACVARAADAGVTMVRVHDVRETRELLDVLSATAPAGESG